MKNNPTIAKKRIIVICIDLLEYMTMIDDYDDYDNVLCIINQSSLSKL